MSYLDQFRRACSISKTGREFVHIGGIIGNFERMRNKITALANDCGSSAMDIGLVDREDAALRDNAEQPTAEGRQALHLDEVAKRAPNPEIICWDCKEKGHPAALCPKRGQAPNANVKGAQYPSQGAGKNSGWNKEWNKGSKGKGKAGKGGKDLNALEPIDDWWDERWVNGDDSRNPMAAHLERVRPKPINVIERATTKATFCKAYNEPCSCFEFMADTVEALGHKSEDEDSGLSNPRPS